MNELVKIMDKQLARIEYQGTPVIMPQQVDELHGRPYGTTNNCFLRHKDKLIEGEDYFMVNYEEWTPLISHLMGNQTGGYRGDRIFLTESGYLLVTKPFTDDLSWQVQRELVRRYFVVKYWGAQFVPGPINRGYPLMVLYDANIERKQLNFHGDKMWAAKIIKDGQPAIYVQLKPLCDAFGMEHKGQWNKLRVKPFFKAGFDLLYMPTRTGCKPQRCLRYELVPLWVVTISPDEEYQNKLLRYQRQFKEFVEIEMDQ